MPNLVQKNGLKKTPVDHFYYLGSRYRNLRHSLADSGWGDINFLGSPMKISHFLYGIPFLAGSKELLRGRYSLF